MKLLLVDDDAFLRDMYATKFKEAGHEVEVAESGKEALSKLSDGSAYDLVLLDMVMPGMSGVELLNAIGTLETIEGNRPKCVVLSNQGEQSDIDKAKAAGAIGYIVKAESIPSEVMDKIQSFL